jgi:putative intracellular protease/amidase
MRRPSGLSARRRGGVSAVGRYKTSRPRCTSHHLTPRLRPTIRRSEPMLKLVRDLFAKGKPVAAICHGPWVLCSTPALKGRTATGFHSIKDDMVNAGATFVDREVVVDANVITSRKPDDLPAFVGAIIEQMRKS